MTARYANGDSAFTGFMISECMGFGVLPVVYNCTVIQ